VSVDFAGTSAQVPAGINSPLAFTRSAVYGAIRFILDPAIPNSAGYFRAVEVRAPEGSIVNPHLPGACGARGITGFRIIDTVLGALAQAAPERVPAGGEGGNTIISMGGYDGRRPFVYVDLIAGARGGSARGDGAEGVPHPGSNIANTPVEIAEVELPVRVEAYGLLPDSGGAGQHRGALGQVRRVRCLAESAVLQVRSDKRRFPPYGLHGGQPGTPSLNQLNSGPSEVLLPTMGMTAIRRDDIIHHTLAGGGGWGDPLTREPALVWRDVWNEKLSIAYAQHVYGVVIDPLTLRLDEPATEQLRRTMRAGQASGIHAPTGDD
jgi:N-methylhydantoinase B